MLVCSNRWYSEARLSSLLRDGSLFVSRKSAFYDTKTFREDVHAGIRLATKTEVIEMYEKVSTDLKFVDREKKVEKFWKDHDIFQKSMDSRKDGPTYTFSALQSPNRTLKNR